MLNLFYAIFSLSVSSFPSLFPFFSLPFLLMSLHLLSLLLTLPLLLFLFSPSHSISLSLLFSPILFLTSSLYSSSLSLHLPPLLIFHHLFPPSHSLFLCPLLLFSSASLLLFPLSHFLPLTTSPPLTLYSSSLPLFSSPPSLPFPFISLIFLSFSGLALDFFQSNLQCLWTIIPSILFKWFKIQMSVPFSINGWWIAPAPSNLVHLFMPIAAKHNKSLWIWTCD